ncbi:MAG: hypothetical protein COA70_08905 [Planctomycetota bacterium]|nr:MAG: hypothetical protein COA70_08905 [Planctomycetota bacterium]
MKNLLPPICAAALAMAFVCSSSAYAQGSQTLPSGYDTVEGNGASAYPFNANADHKWQWHYDAGQFEMDHPPY